MIILFTFQNMIAQSLSHSLDNQIVHMLSYQEQQLYFSQWLKITFYFEDEKHLI